MADINYILPKIYWPAVKQSDIGPIPEYEISVPVEFVGILEVYQVPVCDAYPEGIWAALTSDVSDKNTIEPGCEAHLKTHLLRVNFTGIPSQDTETGMGASGINTVYYKHPDLPVNDSGLNPNEWPKPEVKGE